MNCRAVGSSLAKVWGPLQKLSEALAETGDEENARVVRRATLMLMGVSKRHHVLDNDDMWWHWDGELTPRDGPLPRPVQHRAGVALLERLGRRTRRPHGARHHKRPPRRRPRTVQGARQNRAPRGRARRRRLEPQSGRATVFPPSENRGGLYRASYNFGTAETAARHSETFKSSVEILNLSATSSRGARPLERSEVLRSF